MVAIIRSSVSTSAKLISYLSFNDFGRDRQLAFLIDVYDTNFSAHESDEVFLFAHADTAKNWALCRGVLTHNRKKWGGKERAREQVYVKFPQRKACEMAGKRWFERLDTLHNQQVVCSSHISRLQKAVKIF